MFEVLWIVGVFGYEVKGVVVLTGVGWGPQCTLDRGQKPLVVTRRQQQVVQDLLVRLALLETATQCTVGAFGKNLMSLRCGNGAFPARASCRWPSISKYLVGRSLDHGEDKRVSSGYNQGYNYLINEYTG